MYTQFKVLFFIFTFNLVAFAVLNAVDANNNPLVPGVAYARPANRTLVDVDEAEQQFNATEIVENWENPPGSISLFGDIPYTVINFFSRIRFLIDGLAMTLEWCGGFLPSGQLALASIAWIIRGVGALMFASLMFEIISGRKVQE